MNQYQKTIKKKLVLEGIALHSGALVKIALIPSKENTGIVFLRTDVKKMLPLKPAGKILLKRTYAQKSRIKME